MELHFKEAEDLNSCISSCYKEGCSKIPFFHGTRMYSLQVDEKERERFYVACDKIITFAKNFIGNYPVDMDVFEEYCQMKNPFFLGSVVSQYKTAAYDYGMFYVTTCYPKAIIFANNCGGELGQWAYAQCVGFQDLQIDLDAETYKAAKIVMEEYPKYKSSEKVILVFSGVSFADLQTERGNPFLIFDEDGNPNEVYNEFKIKELYNKATVKDKGTHAPSFRLQNYEEYKAYLIIENDFKKGFSVFTEIRDLDKYLKWNNSKCLRDLL